MWWKFFLGIYSKHNIIKLWKASLQYTIRILKFAKRKTTTWPNKHIIYHLPWNENLVSRGEGLGHKALILGLEKLFASPHCRLDLIHSLFLGYPKFNTVVVVCTVQLYQRSKNFCFQLEKSTLCHSCGHCHDLGQWISSFYSAATATQVWMTQNQHYPNVRFPFHSFPGKFIQTWNSILCINKNMGTNFELFFLKGVYCLLEMHSEYATKMNDFCE